MFGNFVKILNKIDIELFSGNKVDSIRDLEDTSCASGGESLFLAKSIVKGKQVRYYFNDIRFYDASDVYSVKDLSHEWQGFILYTLRDNKTQYEKYLTLIEGFYIKKYLANGKTKALDGEKRFADDIAKVLDCEASWCKAQLIMEEKM